MDDLNKYINKRDEKRAKKFRKKLKKALAVGIGSNWGRDGDEQEFEYPTFAIEYSLIAIIDVLKEKTYHLNNQIDNDDFQRKIKKAISLGVDSGKWDCQLEYYQDELLLDDIDLNLKTSLKSVLKVLEEGKYYG